MPRDVAFYIKPLYDSAKSRSNN